MHFLAKFYVHKMVCTSDFMEHGLETEKLHSHPDLTSKLHSKRVYALTPSGIRKSKLNASQLLHSYSQILHIVKLFFSMGVPF